MRKIVYKIGRILTIKSLSGKKTFEGFLLFAVFYRNRPARLSLRKKSNLMGCFFFAYANRVLTVLSVASLGESAPLGRARIPLSPQTRGIRVF